ncbi:flavin-linked sulfhydryl oxidase ASCRUDRAFT_22568, partial [Ascoidea rubescens DSM 1968]
DQIDSTEKDVQNPQSDIVLKPFMPKMANETLRQELGRATWTLLHNILARYPDNPSSQEKETLNQFLHLFVKVYPCGDCAEHFQRLIEKFPPQINSKQSAALWGCDVHNKVNKFLKKPQYDCTNILNDYDCGCGGDEDDNQNNEFDFSTSYSKSDHIKNIKIDEVERKQKGG